MPSVRGNVEEPMDIPRTRDARPTSGGLPELLTIHDVARILGTHHNTVRRLCRDRKIRFLRVGGKLVRFRREWVEEFINGR
jgi:excisionase family DNA binding protein